MSTGSILARLHAQLSPRIQIFSPGIATSWRYMAKRIRTLSGLLPSSFLLSVVYFFVLRAYLDIYLLVCLSQLISKSYADNGIICTKNSWHVTSICLICVNENLQDNFCN